MSAVLFWKTKSVPFPVGYGADCASLYKAGVNVSGIYTIQPDPADNSTRFNALCDMQTDGGGWTVIQVHALMHWFLTA